MAGHGRGLIVAVLAAVAGGGLSGCQPTPSTATSSWSAVTLSPQDRLLILAPHPDDEVLGCGGVIQDAMAKGLPVRVVFLTYGDNNQWSFLIYRKHPVLRPRAMRAMGLVRHDEAMAADRFLGVSPGQLVFLGYPDFGTLHLWTSHWNDRPPFRSMLTKVTSVPYRNAWRPGAPYTGDEVVRDLTAVLRAFRPTKVFVSHPADHMPDHAALYLFTRVALWDVEQEMRPQVYPYLIHFHRWPTASGWRRAGDLAPPSMFNTTIAWQQYRLTPQQWERKRRAIQAHTTQYRYSARLLLSFVRPNELFGDFPSIALPLHAPTMPVSSVMDNQGGAMHEELTEEERARFVGLEQRHVSLDHGQLILSIRYSRPLAEAVKLSLFVFGYRDDRPFGQMPKLHLQLSALSDTVLDQDQPLTHAGIQVLRQPTQVTIRIPLETLGSPQRILTSARTYLGEVPLDWAAWRILELK